MVKFPLSLIAGETLIACVSYADAVSVTGFVVGEGKYSIAFAAVDGEWRTSTATDDWEPGSYRYEIWATTADGSKRVVQRAGFTVSSSVENTLSGNDQRTRAERVVEKIEAMLEGNAGAGVKSYKINNRELERYSVAELMQLLDYWRGRVAAERRKARGATGTGRIAFYI